MARFHPDAVAWAEFGDRDADSVIARAVIDASWSRALLVVRLVDCHHADPIGLDGYDSADPRGAVAAARREDEESCDSDSDCSTSRSPLRGFRASERRRGAVAHG